MPCLIRGSGKREPSVWGNRRVEPEPKLTNEVPVVVEIPQEKQPIQMLEKSERKFKPGERLIAESKKLEKQSQKKEKPPKKRNYKSSISELLEELFVE